MSETSNSADADSELRAGHPPALKVGNMRVSRNRTNSGNSPREDGEAHDPAPVDPSTGAFVPHNANRQVVAQGGQELLFKDTTDAVKQFHEKPQPTREKPANNVNVQKRMVIQQPK